MAAPAGGMPTPVPSVTDGTGVPGSRGHRVGPPGGEVVGPDDHQGVQRAGVRRGGGPGQRAAVTAAHPRPDFKNRILAAFTEGIRDRPATTFGNVKTDVLAHYVPGFERGDFVETVLGSDWSE